MTVWVLIVYMHTLNAHTIINMQEFNGQKNCQIAGSKIWEFSGHNALWTCVEK